MAFHPILVPLLLAQAALVAAPAAPAPVTPMTPDVVASYDAVLPQADFIRREAMVPMRDGVKLYTVIVMKKGTRGGPILLSRTPYDAHGSTHRTNSQRAVDILAAMDADFIEDGYVRVYQDIRGLYRSEGDFVMNRPIAGPLNPTGIDESTDAFDTIAWLVKNVPEGNGKVGVIGSSYLGFTTLAAEINPHPALKAAVPESPMVDGWMGDDWFHNGAFRVGSLDYALEQSVDKARAEAKIPRGGGDDYTAYLAAGSAGDFARAYAIDQVPFNRKLMENPAYTAFWSGQAVDKWLASRPLTVPTMIELGEWDQEDSYGGPAVWQALKGQPGAKGLLHLVIGPWRHSGANHYGYELGPLTFAGDTAAQWRRQWMKPFLDHYLKDGPDPATPAVLTYASGIDRWESSPDWPMGTATPYYLGPARSAGFARPAAGKISYVADPANPVPFLPRPIDMGDRTQWTTWLVHDQRFVDGRTDVLTFTGQPLSQPVHIMGAPGADIYLATTGSDADVVVKLLDIYPDDLPEAGTQGAKPSQAGLQLPVGIEIFRGRYLKSFAQPAALVPGAVNRFRFTLPNVDHVFLPGHRIGVQVQSSLFPLYDRNPQRFVPNIFNAKPGDYQPATVSVSFGGAEASAVWLPVVPNDARPPVPAH
ncbi:MAG: CocE/NonD family hydrolase [Proteobacteria bacterium]|nr:CocE/NonD family hydrolase [Pseudomonadota bacterium]